MSAERFRVVGADQDEPLPELDFGCTPKRLTFDPRLRTLDKLVAVVLATYAGPKYVCWPTNRTIALCLQMRPDGRYRTLQLSYRRLEEAGWIAREAAPTTKRGEVFRLLWRRSQGTPETGGGARASAGGGRAPAPGGGRAPAPGVIRFKEGELDQEARSRVEDQEPPPSADELAMYRDWASQPRHPFHGIARKFLAEWDAREREGPGHGPA